MKQKAWCIRIVCVISMLLATLSMVDRYAEAKMANEINVSVNESINRFYKQVDGAREFMAQAKAVLIPQHSGTPLSVLSSMQKGLCWTSL